MVGRPGQGIQIGDAGSRPVLDKGTVRAVTDAGHAVPIPPGSEGVHQVYDGALSLASDDDVHGVEFLQDAPLDGGRAGTT